MSHRLSAPDRAFTSGALAVTGSKGGVGKSNLVANLAVAMARWGRRVLLVDGDLGLANLDVLLGLVPKRNVEHLLRGEVGLDDVLVEGPAGVRLLPAASGIPQLASLDDPTRARLLTLLADCSHGIDDVLVDTGAGLGATTLTFQLAASQIVLVTTAEPTSLVDAYATLKVLWAADPTKRVDVVVNAVEDDAEGYRAFEQIARATRQFLGREPGWLGPVYRDPKVAEAVRLQQPVLELFPDCPAGRCYDRIALSLSVSPGARPTETSYWERLAPIADEGLAH